MDKLNNIKLIASDLDGTLLNSNNIVSINNINSIKKARVSGIKFSICTGRNYKGVYDILDLWNIKDEVDYIIASNGGEIFNLKTKKLVETYKLEPQIIKELIEIFKEADVAFTLYDNNYLYASRLDDSVITVSKRVKSVVRVIDLNEILNKPYFKLLLTFDSKKMDLVQAIYNSNINLKKYKGFKSYNDLFELTHPNTGKEVGIKYLMEELNIKNENVVAFGDNTNDYSMIEYCINSVVMENGSDDVKKIAKYISDSNDNDGVSKFIEKYIIQ